MTQVKDTDDQKALTIEELSELLQYIEKHNSWKNNLKAQRLIKYVDFSFDTRDCTVWKINLRLSGQGEPHSVQRRDTTLKIKCMST